MTKFEGFGELRDELLEVIHIFKFKTIFEKYIGQFKEGKKDGEGILYNKDDSIK